MFKYPAGLLTKTGTIDSAEFFNTHMIQIQGVLGRAQAFQHRDDDTSVMTEVKGMLQKLLSSLEGVQFALCELSKICNWLRTRNNTYARGYWSTHERLVDSNVTMKKTGRPVTWAKYLTA